MTELEKYYNKFNEDHRLTTRHGRVEFNTSMKFIHDYIGERKGLCIADIGAGTGRYSIALAREGHDVTAVELVERNLKVLESKHEHVKCWPGNALDLSFLPKDKFDITILFGPLYHLQKKEERVKALNEAKRITKNGGYIFCGYVMNEYSIISWCVKNNKFAECMKNKTLTEDFHAITAEKDLYFYSRLEDMDFLNSSCGLESVKRFAPDGPADYIRKELNALDEESFEYFMQYQLAVCERPELLGASSHVVDVLKVSK